MDLKNEPIDLTGNPLSGFKTAKIKDLRELENGTYWSELHPYFLRPEYQRLRYAIRGRARGVLERDETVSIRAASSAGELDLAFIADQLAATMSIADAGLPDYCLTWVCRGQLLYSGTITTPLVIDENVGLIYRGSPETNLVANVAHKRLAIWISRASINQRLAALLDAPVVTDTEFHPTFKWNEVGPRALRHLLDFLMLELQSAAPFTLGSEAANRSFTDLFGYTLLRSLPHTYSDQISRPNYRPTPGMLRRAEAYIHAQVEEPIALHDVAAAAGCSIRTLQLAFRSFRETTPLLAIRQARLDAARTALLSSGDGSTVTAIAHRFGFSNPGRFTRLYKSAYGESPAEVIANRKA